MTTYENNIFEQAYQCLCLPDPVLKVINTQALYQHWLTDGVLPLSVNEAVKVQVPGRPEKPVLVKPSEVPKRGFDSQSGRLKLVHAIAHIEFNAINLAVDAVYRFRDMPVQYYTDWLKVAVEEALHFTLLKDYLESCDVSYGDYAAHNGLWEMAVMTDHDVLVRMALVPRVLEARGLDVTPGYDQQTRTPG